MKKELYLDNQKIVYFEEGTGFPFLIIHGWGGAVSPSANLNFQRLLAEQGFHVFVISMPGFGESSLPELKTKTDEMTECVLKFVEKLEIKEFVIYGHCFGGLIAIKLAKRCPEKIKSLILCGVPSPKIIKTLTKISFLGLGPFFLIALLTWLFMPSVFTLKGLRKWIKLQANFYKRKKAIMLRAWKRVMLQDFEKNYLGIEKINIPTFIVRGEKDNIVIKKGFEFFKHIPNSKFKVISKVGHSIQLDSPEILTKEVTIFANTVIKSNNKDLPEQEKIFTI